MNRDHSLAQLAGSTQTWDVIVIGGGATGLGCAIDAATRGYRTALIEQSDFAKGTSSRSTKLIHGGVRYLRQGNIALVKEGLRERGILLRNAPHLVRKRAFVIPAYDWWERPFYGAGMKMYDALAGDLGIGKSQILNRAETLEKLPNIQSANLRGGVLYHDAQFDDARLAVHLALTLADHGGVPINYIRVKQLIKEGAKISGVLAVDVENATEFQIRGRVVINATGVFVDEVVKMDDPAASRLVTPSQGIHLTVDRDFLPGDSAIMAPRTTDGRVLFAVPWHQKVILGTTDTKVEAVDPEPRALPEEIEFVLNNASRYLARSPKAEDIRSIFAGLRPLMRSTSANTAKIARDHYLTVSPAGLVTITGGKWTTYRRMGEETINLAAKTAGLPTRPSRTKELPVHGAESLQRDQLAVYGSDAEKIQHLISEDSDLGKALHPRLPYLQAEVIWAIRNEMARTVEDILARRTRALILDAQASLEAAPLAAQLLADELRQTSAWGDRQVTEYASLAARYMAAAP